MTTNPQAPPRATKIYKYTLIVADEQVVDLPAGARLLDVQDQHGQPRLWAIVDPGARLVERKLAMRGTGHDATGLEDAPHVGTFQMRDGLLVFHVFDLGEKP